MRRWLLLTCSLSLAGLVGWAKHPSGLSVAAAVRQPEPVPEPVMVPAPVVEENPSPEVVEVALEPYFSEGSQRKAKQAFDRGDYRKSRALLGATPASPPWVRYLAGLAAYRLKQWPVAAAELEAVAEDYPPMAASARTLAGKAWLNAKQFARAAKVLGQVEDTSPAWVEARLAEAQAHEGARAYEAALSTLEPLLSDPETLSRGTRADTLEWAARLAQRLGRQESRRQWMLELWSKHPDSRHASRIEKQLKSRELTLSARAARADQLVSMYRYAQARKEAARILKAVKLPDPDACMAQFVIGKSHRVERRHPEAIAALTPVMQRCAGDTKARAMFILASSQSIVAKPEGLRTYLALAQEFSGHSFADDALYYAADLAVQAGDRESGRAYYQALLQQMPTGDYAQAAAFRRFWLWYEDRKWGEALLALAEFEQTLSAPQDAHLRAQARYWTARVLEHQGQGEQAKAAYLQVVEQHPGTLYAGWAHQRLGAGASFSSAPHQGDPQRGLNELAKDSRFLLAVELARMQLPEAKKALASVSLSDKSEDAAAALLEVMSELGLQEVYGWMPETSLAGVLYGPLNDSTLSVFRAHRPLQLRELLTRQATRMGVEVELVQGVVHRESGFNPRARSPVGALGLMQLMPDTAQILARRLKVKLPSSRELNVPELNAKLGSFYLADLIRRFDGRAELAVAAYNAGPTRVQRWWNDSPTKEVDEFVESIPIKETRLYVKNVLGDRSAYRLLKWKNSVAAAGRSGVNGG